MAADVEGGTAAVFACANVIRIHRIRNDNARKPRMHFSDLVIEGKSIFSGNRKRQDKKIRLALQRTLKTRSRIVRMNARMAGGFHSPTENVGVWNIRMRK